MLVVGMWSWVIIDVNALVCLRGRECVEMCVWLCDLVRKIARAQQPQVTQTDKDVRSPATPSNRLIRMSGASMCTTTFTGGTTGGQEAILTRPGMKMAPSECKCTR